MDVELDSVQATEYFFKGALKKIKCHSERAARIVKRRKKNLEKTLEKKSRENGQAEVREAGRTNERNGLKAYH